MYEPKNPRIKYPNHKERGPKRFIYTYGDLATLFNVKVDTIRHWVSNGKLDPYSLSSIVLLYTGRE